MDTMLKKYCSILIIMLVLACLLSAFKVAEQKSIQTLEQVGITGADLRNYIWTSFAGGGFSYPNIASLKRITASDRAGVVREVVAYAKSYSTTDEFKARYLEHREAQKPKPPEPPKSMAQQQKAFQESQQKAIKDLEAAMKTMPPEQQAMFKEAITTMRQQMKEAGNANNPMFGAQGDEFNRQSHESAMREHQVKLADWQRDFPESPQKMIKQWLTRFLDVSKNVDFDAKLKPGPGRKMVFVNPAYEAKSSEWKTCYRAGKDVETAGRLAAQQWLGELK